MSELPTKPLPDAVGLENVDKDAINEKSYSVTERLGSVKLKGIRPTEPKPVTGSVSSKQDTYRPEAWQHCNTRYSSQGTRHHHESTIANNIELFLKKRRELLCCADSSISRSNGGYYDRNRPASGQEDNFKPSGNNATDDLEFPAGGIHTTLVEPTAIPVKASIPVTRSSNSPARFLECCLAAESGAKDLFSSSYFRMENEQTRRVNADNRGDGNGQCCSTPAKGFGGVDKCNVNHPSPHQCNGACASCCNSRSELDGSLKMKKASKSVCSGDVKTSDSGIHNEVDCCRICQEDGTFEKLISPCYCSGTVGFMHMSCLETWLGLNGRTTCELCLFPFPVVKIRPTLLQFFSHPLTNMDFASLLCDIACFCVLTPLLIASTYLCSIGVSHYEEVGKTGSVFAIVTLMVSLIAVYISWAVLAILYHRRVFLTWRDKTARIQMWTDKNNPSANLKMTSSDLNKVSDSSPPGDTPLATQKQSGTSLILKPMLWYSYRLRSHGSGSSIPFNQGGDFNSNQLEEQGKNRRLQQQEKCKLAVIKGPGASLPAAHNIV